MQTEAEFDSQVLQIRSHVLQVPRLLKYPYLQIIQTYTFAEEHLSQLLAHTARTVSFF